MVEGAAQLRILTTILAATAEAAHNLSRVLADQADEPPRAPLALDSPLSPVRALLREHAAAAHWTALALDLVLAASHGHALSPPPLVGTLRAAPPSVPNARAPTAAAPHAELVELDLCELLCTLVDATAFIGERHKTRVHFVCAEPFCTVRADPAQLARTLLLALGLVLDAADPGGFLALELHIDTDGARLGIEVLPAHADPDLDYLTPEAAWDTLVGSIARLGCPVSVAPPVSRAAADLASQVVSEAGEHALPRVPLLGIELTLPVLVVSKAHPPRVGTTSGTISSTMASESRGASFSLGAASILHSMLLWPPGAAAHADATPGAGEDAASLSFWRFCSQLLLGAHKPSGLTPPLTVGLVAGAGIDSELGDAPVPISPLVNGTAQRCNSFLGVTPRVWSPAWGAFPFQSLANLTYGTDAAGVVAAVDKLPPLVVVSNVQVPDMAVMLAALQAQLQGDAKPAAAGPAEDHADPVTKAPSVGVLVHVPDQPSVHAVLRVLHEMNWCPSTIAVQIACGCVPVPSLVAHLYDLYKRTRAGMLAMRQYAPGYVTPAIARDPAWPAESPGVALPLTPVTPNRFASACNTTPQRATVRAAGDETPSGHGWMEPGASAHDPRPSAAPEPVSPTSPADWTAPTARPPTYTRARSSFRGTAPSPTGRASSSPRAGTPPMHLLSLASPARPGASPVSSGTAPVLVEPPPRLSRAFTMQDPMWIRRRIDFQAGFPGGAPAATTGDASTPPAAETPSPPMPAAPPAQPPGLRRTASRKAVPPPLDIAATMSSRLARQEVESARLAMTTKHAFHRSSSSVSTRTADLSAPSAASDVALALPPPPRPAKAYSSPDHRARGGGRVIPPIRVLLVEDNPINLRILTAFLSQRGIRYAAARDGAEAVNVFAAAPPGSGTEFHLVLMDVQLPVMDGLEATCRIRGVEAKWDSDRRAAARRKNHHQGAAPASTGTRRTGAAPPPPARNGGGSTRPVSASLVATTGMTARRRAFSQPEAVIAAVAAKGSRATGKRSPPTSTPTSPIKKASPPVGMVKSRSPGAVGISARVRVRTGGSSARPTPPGRSLADLGRAHAARTAAVAAAAAGKRDLEETRPTHSEPAAIATPVPAGCNSIVVALTASSTPDDRKAALQAGCNDFISKPLNLKWLESKIIEWGSIQSIIKFSQ
ncbi:hypothetical protein AMAG_08594 [Allomyces macrogynus ATCC 38327]|uniref:Response regulatory domain-containing protein n=1 Tax=Allomyces macrogynus (strain ATCC 38327) TaxID=578462 RepID=A0A0L0SLZ5_ALLM3|nr:hypothetical protein AMAG_08594 [Allomyces macrogynus ATCC 38327]|eukprot:KNE63468.1 hypothetical protein AMAG_08594 [Allomyces macrogynus ATCC 38327]